MFNFLRENKIFAAVFFAIFAVYFSAVFLPIEKILSYFVIDDSFYYFKIASNISKGLGPTFDGEHFTNGYHPIWMGIAVLVYYFIPYDKILAVKMILGLSVFIYFLTSLVVWKIINLLVDDRTIRYILVGAYVLNPWNLTFFLNGLETPLSILFFSLLLLLSFKIFSGADGDGNFIYLGLISGLLILARLDYGLFVALVGLSILWRRYSLRKIFLFGIPAFLLAAPWFIYNRIYFGSLFPTSGLAYTLINHRLFFYKIRSSLEVILWSIYNFGGSFAFSLKSAGLPFPYYAIEVWEKSVAWMVLICGLLTAPVWYIYKKNGSEFLKSARWITFNTFLFGFLSLVFVHGAVRWSGRPWYFSVFPVIWILFASLLFSEESFSWIRRKAAFLFFISYIGLYGFYAVNIFPDQLNQVDMYRAAIWVRENLPKDARIASFNSGILGYFSDRFVMNSDGLVNQPAYEAMKESRLWNFFNQKEIDYMVDYEIAFTYRYKSFLGVESPLDFLEKIDFPISGSGGNYAGSSLGAYHLK